jgi:hypothetical protein
VILADFTVDDRGMLEIDPISHRRYVVSFASYFFMCRPAQAIGEQKVVKEFTAQIRKVVAEHVDAQAMREVEAGGDATAVTGLDMTTLRGVTPRSKLGQFVAGRTIADVASVDRASFVAEADKANVDSDKAAKLWDAASTLTKKIGPG